MLRLQVRAVGPQRRAPLQTIRRGHRTRAFTEESSATQEVPFNGKPSPPRFTLMVCASFADSANWACSSPTNWPPVLPSALAQAYGADEVDKARPSGVCRVLAGRSPSAAPPLNVDCRARWRPAAFLWHPENVLRFVFVLVLGIGARVVTLARDELGAVFLEGI